MRCWVLRGRLYGGSTEVIWIWRGIAVGLDGGEGK